MQYLAKNNNNVVTLTQQSTGNMCGITNSSYPALKTDTDDQTTIHAQMAGVPIKISEILTNSDREAA